MVESPGFEPIIKQHREIKGPRQRKSMKKQKVKKTVCIYFAIDAHAYLPRVFADDGARNRPSVKEMHHTRMVVAYLPINCQPNVPGEKRRQGQVQQTSAAPQRDVYQLLQ